MKKFFANIKNKATEMAARAKSAIENVRAEGYVDSGVKILIAVVIGALLLAGLYTLFNSTIMPTVTQKIQELFNYKG
jgi:outer membrane murein-binding lipoprotein Lpp